MFKVLVLKSALREGGVCAQVCLYCMSEYVQVYLRDHTKSRIFVTKMTALAAPAEPEGRGLCTV